MNQNKNELKQIKKSNHGLVVERRRDAASPTQASR